MKNSKQTIRLTESELHEIIAETTKQAINELSPEFLAGAYKSAEDRWYNSKSPMERQKRRGQSDRFKQATIDKYNEKYASEYNDDGIDHKMTDIYYSPATKGAHARTVTRDTAGDMFTDYTREYPEGKIDTGSSSNMSYVGREAKPRAMNRASRGEKTITKSITDLNANESKKPVSITESQLKQIIDESVKKALENIKK